MHPEIIVRINKVLDYVEEHLSEELQLERLAEIAHLSKFHFHRTFKIITKEAPNEYKTRKRIEKIASLILHDSNESISDLSFKYGFTNLSSFSRAFKKHYGFSASELRQKAKKSIDQESIENSKIGKTVDWYEDYLSSVNQINRWMVNKAEIEIREMPATKLAYMRHWGSPYTIHEAYEKLMDWQSKVSDTSLFGDYFTLFHDNPSLTVDYKIQQSACVELKNLNFNESDISVTQLPPQKYVIGSFELDESEFEMAWNSMLVWINEKNLKIIDGPRYERFLGNSLFNNSATYQLEIGITVK